MIFEFLSNHIGQMINWEKKNPTKFKEEIEKPKIANQNYNQFNEEEKKFDHEEEKDYPMEVSRCEVCKRHVNSNDQ